LLAAKKLDGDDAGPEEDWLLWVEEEWVLLL